MNYNKWGMICTVQYMDLTPPVNIDELQQVEYDVYCTIHGSYSVQYMDWLHIDELQQVEYDNMYSTYNTWMICTVQSTC